MKQPHKAALINTNTLLNVTDAQFGIRALELFRYQYERNQIYQSYCKALGRNPQYVSRIEDIPFLPISFFKTHEVITAPATAASSDLVFESSGTTGTVNSRHYVWDKQIYADSLLSGFHEYYGLPEHYVILGLLPSYLERPNASLVYMAQTLMACSGRQECGFYMYNFEELYNTIEKLEGQGRATLLIGVTFALLDFADQYKMPLKHTILMETGGMKGRRKEMTREEVHGILKESFSIGNIHSEYGMTELLSQAYASRDGLFSASQTMKVLIRDINDPLDVSTTGSGVLNVIDLANVHSCAFIATEDLGTLHADGTFSVLGRLDHSALRGCSLMAL